MSYGARSQYRCVISIIISPAYREVVTYCLQYVTLTCQYTDCGVNARFCWSLGNMPRNTLVLMSINGVYLLINSRDTNDLVMTRYSSHTSCNGVLCDVLFPLDNTSLRSVVLLQPFFLLPYNFLKVTITILIMQCFDINLAIGGVQLISNIINASCTALIRIDYIVVARMNLSQIKLSWAR